MTTRRLEFKQGSSNKFYEVTILNENGSWKVKTKWGRIGNLGQMQEIPCGYQTQANIIAGEKVREKIRKGYVEIKEGEVIQGVLNKPPEEKTELREAKDEVKLPHIWEKLQDKLLPGERNIYEKYDDGRTKQRRNAIASRYKALILEPCEESEMKEVKAAAWLFLSFTYLRYLTSVGTYKPATHELARATVSQLQKKLQQLPEEQKAAIDAGLKKFTGKSGPLSLSECNLGVEAFINAMTQEIKEKHKVGVGGVSRIRAKMLARRRRNNEKKKRARK